MQLIRPDWPAPPWVQACCTTRSGGVSTGVWAGLNLGDHVGDEPRHVARNRAALRTALNLPADPLWLNQVHGCTVAQSATAVPGCTADAAVACRPGAVCAVLTADCLPLLICDRRGRRVAAVHAGWRGLAAGVIEGTLKALGESPADLLVWLGPAIGPAAFVVGPEVRAAFLAADPAAIGAFQPAAGDRWLADLFALARARLAQAGVTRVYGGGDCTYSDPERFFSFRRDGVTGRMASLIWLGDSTGSDFFASRTNLTP
ncbi:peptidoglycan editing factor PgeF [uncultured Thiodictyon sp.]|uniref:peptidoglycan editing factor PgeF n=1 Tax=uncultured Thiodictyon sp. TaxID=1846217 RepID=UPI0025D42089|nr:peptidoglycan editing factor PgeF [uncultured Thiodictyon sp.]